MISVTVWETTVVGAAAGAAVYLGLPVARLRDRAAPQSFLTSLALGALLLVVWDVLSRALGLVENALHDSVKSGHWQSFFSLAAMLALGLVIGLVGPAALISTQSSASPDPAPRSIYAMRMPPSQLAVIIATGLGLYNLAEGLTIGQVAAGSPATAAGLAAEMGLYNIAAGLAIAAPLAFADAPPPWSFLRAAGLIAGAPMPLGALAGAMWRSPLASVFFLAMGAGALVFVVGELFAVSRRFRQPIWSVWGTLIGFLAAYSVNLVLTTGGV